MATDTPAIEVAHRWDHGCSWKLQGAGQLACRSHALRDLDGRVWLVDPIDGIGLDALLAELDGDVVGVIVLLDRHLRDAESLASRHECRLLVPPGRWRPGHPAPAAAERIAGEVAACPFRFLPLVVRPGQWLEWALWWPDQRVLVIAEAAGSANYYLASAQERLAIHPMLRVLGPPTALADASMEPEPELLLMGHGDAVEGTDIEQLLTGAVEAARRTLPAYAVRSAALAAREASSWIRSRLQQVRDT